MLLVNIYKNMFSCVVKVHRLHLGLAPAMASHLAGLRFLSGQPLLGSYWLIHNTDILWHWELCPEMNSSSIFDQQSTTIIAQWLWTSQQKPCLIGLDQSRKEICCWHAAQHHLSSNNVIVYLILYNLIYANSLLSGCFDVLKKTQSVPEF